MANGALDKLRHMLMELLQLQMCLCGLTTLPLLATVPSVLTALPLLHCTLYLLASLAMPMITSASGGLCCSPAAC